MNATNVAMGLVERGMCSDDVVVPIFSCNGRLAQILAVYFLPATTFPVVCFVTTVLDLFDKAGLALAATALEKCFNTAAELIVCATLQNHFL